MNNQLELYGVDCENYLEKLTISSNNLFALLKRYVSPKIMNYYEPKRDSMLKACSTMSLRYFEKNVISKVIDECEIRGTRNYDYTLEDVVIVPENINIDKIKSTDYKAIKQLIAKSEPILVK